MYLLDTCTLLWLAGNAHQHLSKKAQEAIAGFPGQLAISAISALEIAMHKDLCDRVIIATAQAYVFTILTPDELIAKYPGVAILW